MRYLTIATTTLLGALAAFSAAPQPAEAQVSRGYCQDRIRAAPRIQRHCIDLDMSVDLKDHPYVYTNKDAGCDLGLSLPGLPDFSNLGFNIDSCRILRAVTGDLVREINTTFQRAVDETVGAAADRFNDIDIDPEQYIIDQAAP